MSRSSAFYKAVLLLIIVNCQFSIVNAQKLEWKLGAEGFFDNGEGDDTYRTTMTYSGLRVTPEIGISWDEGKHRFMGGYSGLAEFGKKHGFTDGTPVLYYQYQTKPLTFTFGSFMRDQLLGDYPSYMMSDTIRYYRPVMQGFVFQHQHSRGYFEAFLDWTGLRSDKDREQFMAGLSVKHIVGKQNDSSWSKVNGQFFVGMEGYYYHYALTWHADESQHIHDYLVAHPYIGYQLQSRVTAASVEVKAGALFSFDRERGMENGSRTPIGFLGEVNAHWKHLSLQEIFYAGGHQQPFGKAYFGKFYWGDSYYHAPAYSRTDIRYQFIRNEWVEADAGVVFNITKAGLNWHQMLSVRLNIGSYRHAKINL